MIDLVYEFRHIFSDIQRRTSIVKVDIVLEKDRVVNVYLILFLVVYIVN